MLLAQYAHFNSYQLLRLMQWPVAGQARQAGQAGQAGQAETVLRFRADLSAGFAGHEFSALRSYRADAGYEVIEIRTANYCIASLLGPLPESFTEWVRDLKRARSEAMADFLDMFNHRLNLLRYRIKARQTLALNNRPPEQTEHAAQLAAIMGLGLPQLAEQIALPKRSWLALSGLLANCRRSAAAIGQVLSLYLGARVRVQPLVGAWQAIEPEERMALGRRRHALGHSSLLGRKVWDQAARVRLVVEALDYAQFCQLLPPELARAEAADRSADQSNRVDSAPYFGLQGLLRLLLNGLHDCEVELSLRTASAPPARLLSRGDTNNAGQRLHYSAWLGGPGSLAAARTVRFLIPAFAVSPALSSQVPA